MSSDAGRRRLHDVLPALTIQPTRVDLMDELSDVARAAVQNPACRVISVEQDGRVVGLIPLAQLVEHVQLRFASGTADIRISERAGKHFRQLAVRTAGAVMTSPVAVSPTTCVEDAVRLMQRTALEGLPVVDDQARVVAYADKLELIWLSGQHSPAA